MATDHPVPRHRRETLVSTPKWQWARLQYIRTNSSLQDLAGICGISYHALARRCRRENWVSQRQHWFAQVSPPPPEPLTPSLMSIPDWKTPVREKVEAGNRIVETSLAYRPAPWRFMELFHPDGRVEIVMPPKSSDGTEP